MGGSGAIIDALVRGLRKHGGRLELRAHVAEILTEGAGERRRASGVRLRDGSVVRARRAVISNATLWDTAPLLPEGCGAASRNPPNSRLLPATRACCRLRPQQRRHAAPAPCLRRRRAVPKEWLQQQLSTKQCESFVHLHLGIDGARAPPLPLCSPLSRRQWL